MGRRRADQRAERLHEPGGFFAHPAEQHELQLLELVQLRFAGQCSVGQQRIADNQHKHDDQWLSAYGHNRARLVNEGQLVKAGQQIAEMGRSGASRDMLHFEIRYNGKPVNPQQYLPGR